MSIHHPTFFDIETGPLPTAELLQFMPDFEPARNLKDPEKIKTSVDDQRARWLADAALSAVTGQVLAIGLAHPQIEILQGSEPQMLGAFWELASDVVHAGNWLIGFYCKTFDLPFLVRRSFKHGVKVPRCILSGRYWGDFVVDMADYWSCGSRDPRDRISLDNLSKFLGTGAKNGDGAEFHKLWATDRDKAIAYLTNDLELTRKAWEAMTGNE